MEKPRRVASATPSGSGSASASPPRSRSRSRKKSLSLSSSQSHSCVSPSRSPPPQPTSRTGGASRRGRSPPPATKRASPSPRKLSPVLESVVLNTDQLTRNVNEGHLTEIFSNFGEVNNVELPMAHSVNLPRGCGYAEFKTIADAEISKPPVSQQEPQPQVRNTDGADSKEGMDITVLDSLHVSAATEPELVNLIKEFHRLDPPAFMGASNPAEAEEWFREIEKKLSLIRVNDGQRAALATSMLKGEAIYWWEINKHTMYNIGMSWRDFQETFLERYFPFSDRSMKKYELMQLAQKGDTIETKSKEKMTTLSSNLTGRQRKQHHPYSPSALIETTVAEKKCSKCGQTGHILKCCQLRQQEGKQEEKQEEQQTQFGAPLEIEGEDICARKKKRKKEKNESSNPNPNLRRQEEEQQHRHPDSQPALVVDGQEVQQTSLGQTGQLRQQEGKQEEQQTQFSAPLEIEGDEFCARKKKRKKEKNKSSNPNPNFRRQEEEQQHHHPDSQPALVVDGQEVQQTSVGQTGQLRQQEGKQEEQQTQFGAPLEIEGEDFCARKKKRKKEKNESSNPNPNLRRQEDEQQHHHPDSQPALVVDGQEVQQTSLGQTGQLRQQEEKQEEQQTQFGAPLEIEGEDFCARKKKRKKEKNESSNPNPNLRRQEEEQQHHHPDSQPALVVDGQEVQQTSLGQTGQLRQQEGKQEEKQEEQQTQFGAPLEIEGEDFCARKKKRKKEKNESSNPNPNLRRQEEEQQHHHPDSQPALVVDGQEVQQTSLGQTGQLRQQEEQQTQFGAPLEIEGEDFCVRKKKRKKEKNESSNPNPNLRRQEEEQHHHPDSQPALVVDGQEVQQTSLGQTGQLRQQEGKQEEKQEEQQTQFGAPLEIEGEDFCARKKKRKKEKNESSNPNPNLRRQEEEQQHHHPDSQPALVVDGQEVQQTSLGQTGQLRQQEEKQEEQQTQFGAPLEIEGEDFCARKKKRKKEKNKSSNPNPNLRSQEEEQQHHHPDSQPALVVYGQEVQQTSLGQTGQLRQQEGKQEEKQEEQQTQFGASLEIEGEDFCARKKKRKKEKNESSNPNPNLRRQEEEQQHHHPDSQPALVVDGQEVQQTSLGQTGQLRQQEGKQEEKQEEQQTQFGAPLEIEGEDFCARKKKRKKEKNESSNPNPNPNPNLRRHEEQQQHHHPDSQPALVVDGQEVQQTSLGQTGQLRQQEGKQEEKQEEQQTQFGAPLEIEGEDFCARKKKRKKEKNESSNPNPNPNPNPNLRRHEEQQQHHHPDSQPALVVDGEGVKQTSHGQRKCKECGHLGHSRKDCPLWLQQQKLKKQKKLLWVQQTFHGQRKCKECGDLGHSRKDCPLWLQQQKQQQEQKLLRKQQHEQQQQEHQQRRQQKQQLEKQKQEELERRKHEQQQRHKKKKEDEAKSRRQDKRQQPEVAILEVNLEDFFASEKKRIWAREKKKKEDSINQLEIRRKRKEGILKRRQQNQPAPVV